ncbi:MAG TPA: CsgG/HfaB family protein [Chitinivibrionales bacterium]|jgi:curli biogenesis system outer membrane secretion channel CsgG|nr:CsgG/HfaB family protein [Chitinivibrionales bacterium]
MKFLVHHILVFMLFVVLSGSILGCASTLSGHKILEITDETEVQGCKKLGLVIGKSHWGGLTGQELSLDVAKKRALQHARAKGATHVLWLDMKTGVFGASVSGQAYACSNNAGKIVGNPDTASKIIPVSKSLSTKKPGTAGFAAVMRFECTGIDSGVSMVITDIFTNQLQAAGKYRVMERSQMNKILGEQGFQSSGACNSTECAVEIGRLLSIDKMFIGSIGKLGESWFISVRMVNVQTGEIVSNVSKQVVGKVDNLSAAAIQMANEFSQEN